MTNRGIELIKRHEGCRLKAYKCPAGVWTIGYGHTQGVFDGKTITQDEAERLLLNDLTRFELGVRNIVGDLTDNKIDALVSFAYNVGLQAFQTSTLCRKVKANPNDTSIRNEFMRWVFAGKTKLKGLEKRRKDEADLYFA